MQQQVPPDIFAVEICHISQNQCAETESNQSYLQTIRDSDMSESLKYKWSQCNDDHQHHFKYFEG